MNRDSSAQAYAVHQGRKFYKDEARRLPQARTTQGPLGSATTIQELMESRPAASRRFMMMKEQQAQEQQKQRVEGDNFKNLLAVSQSVEIPKARNFLDVSDIKGAHPKELYGHKMYNKNEDLMRDSVLGRKKPIVKESDPLDPSYVVKSPSGRRMMQIGEIDKSKPNILIQ